MNTPRFPTKNFPQTKLSHSSKISTTFAEISHHLSRRETDSRHFTLRCRRAPKLDLAGFLRTLGNAPTLISAITISELQQGSLRAPVGRHRDDRARHVSRCLAKFRAVPFDAVIALTHADIWAKLEASGQRIGANDLIIAATALAVGYSVATLNLSVFRRVPSLPFIDASPFFR